MPRKASSQWSFGELFDTHELQQVFGVSELTGNVRRLLEERIGTVRVRGEVTNLRVQSSGHAYFALKDPGAQLNCVLFRGGAAAERVLLDNGVLLIAHGELTVYEPRGQYQLVVRELELQGAGALQAAFEKLKRQLESQGYFAPERKRSLRRIPERIGLVTSASGAAIQDVLHVIERRHPGLEVVLSSCRVQGDGAAAEIALAIEALNRWSGLQPRGRGLDLILVTRGGGSIEDLWAFNELVVAEAIYRSALPVISAVGHETDFTISDFVADLRAATPSAAAEIITEGAIAGRRIVQERSRALRRTVETEFDALREDCKAFTDRLLRCRPTRKLQEAMQYLDEIRDRARRSGRGAIGSALRNFAAALGRVRRFRLRAQLAGKHDRFGRARAALLRVRVLKVQQAQDRLASASRQLRVLSPDGTLARGYSITTDSKGRIIRRAGEVAAGELIRSRVTDGTIESQVTNGR